MESGNCPKCGESDIHNKEVAWECQACGYSWPKDTPPVDSKGAAIDKILDIHDNKLMMLAHSLTGRPKSEKNRYEKMLQGFDAEARQAILVILAQEVEVAQVEARIAELWNPGLRIPENESVIRERTAQLNEELNQLTDRKAGLV